MEVMGFTATPLGELNMAAKRLPSANPAVPLPAFVFDESAVGPECFYSRTPAHLEALAERARDQGIPVVFPDPVAARAPFLAEWRRRGLIT
jgi:hypothetical protein